MHEIGRPILSRAAAFKLNRKFGLFILPFASCAIAIIWLLPSHYFPWTAFYSDAWAALIFGALAATVIFTAQRPFSWNRLSILFAILACIPFLQYFFDSLPFVEQAWMATVYLLGLLLALHTGTHSEKSHPWQLAGCLFFAVGIASVLSVGMQFNQWLQMDGFGIVSMGLTGTRPYANLGQPNQLGTLLLWGLLACGWGYVTRKITPYFGVLIACYLLFGIGLTQSRTAWLGLAIIFVAAWGWRKLWPSPKAPWVIAALGLYFIFLWLVVLPWLANVFRLTAPSDFVGRMQGETRPAIWQLFIDAILERPWFGYGFRDTTAAQLEVALNHDALSGMFAHSHNLILDLILWCGIPIGISVSVFLLWWFVKAVRSIADIKDLLLLAFIALVANHAMMELPLHHAYFLLPTGLVMGVISARQNHQVVAFTSRRTLIILWLMAMSALGLIIRDYLKVEHNLSLLRLERSAAGKLPPVEPPDVLMLTRLKAELRFARIMPTENMGEAELQFMRQVAEVRPGTGEILKLASALALNDSPDEAQLWLKKLCKVQVGQCETVKLIWAEYGRKSPKFAAVQWPN